MFSGVFVSTFFIAFFALASFFCGVTMARSYPKQYKRLQFTNNGIGNFEEGGAGGAEGRTCAATRDYCMFAHVNRDTGRILDYPGWCICRQGTSCVFSHVNHQRQWLFTCQKDKE